MTSYYCTAIATILDLAQHLYRRGSMLNERYLHHAFGPRLQGVRGRGRLDAERDDHHRQPRL